MARFTVTHSCGHEAEHVFIGTEEEIRRREAWLREQPCKACKRGRGPEGESPLPPLEGRGDEMAWAEPIRDKVIAHNRAYYRQYQVERPFSGNAELREAADAAAAAAMADLQNVRSAAWWIDKRFEAFDFVKVRIAAAIAPIMRARETPPT